MYDGVIRPVAGGGINERGFELEENQKECGIRCGIMYAHSDSGT